MIYSGKCGTNKFEENSDQSKKPSAPQVTTTAQQTPEQPKQTGGKPKSSPKASAKRIMINGKSRVVYIGTRGGEYIKASGEFVTVKSAVKSAKKAEKEAKTAAKAKKVVKRGKQGQRGGGRL